MSSAALELAGVEAVYHSAVRALHGVSLAVAAGEIVALLGANGAGKTTALKAISGVLPLEGGRVTSGSIRFDGEDVERRLPHELVRRGMFHVREGRHIFGDMTVEENLVAATFALTGRGRPPRDFSEVYAYFPLLRERRRQLAGYLSGGEQQMLAIGRALVARPRLILLDEPSLGLAPIVVREIFTMIQRINREEGASMLLVEQNAAAAFRVASYAYILESGRVVLEGPASRLVDNPEVRRSYLGVAAGAPATGPEDRK